MPLLLGKTSSLAHHDWSVKKMGRAIDCFHDALVEIKKDSKKILDEKFLTSIFESLQLTPLDEYMKYVFDIKKGPTTNSKVGDNKKAVQCLGRYIRQELFKPTREENQATNKLLLEWGSSVATSLLEEIRDPTKLTSDHLSSEDGRLSWLNTTTAEHEASKGKDATNDNSESPFGSLTAQLQSFTTVGINHASAMALARFNCDFYRNEVELEMRIKQKGKESLGENGNFLNLDFEESQSLLQIAFELSAAVRDAEKNALEAQWSKKRHKKETLLKNKLDGATKAYVDKLHYCKMCDSAACWRTCNRVDHELKAITSETTKREALKDQIRMRVLGLGWEDCHHPWLSGGVVFTPQQLATHLKNNIIKKHSKRQIPPKPPVDLPKRKSLPVLGTLSPDIVRRDAERAAEEIKLIESAEKLMKELEEKGFGDRFADMQQRSAPKVDMSLKGKRLEVLCRYFEEDGTPFFCWAKCTVDGMPEKEAKKTGGSKNGKRTRGDNGSDNDTAIVTWDDEYCVKGGAATTRQKLPKNKWNKHGPGAWRFVLEGK